MNTPEHGAPLRKWMLVAVTAALTAFSCAHTEKVDKTDAVAVDALQVRLEEAERSNARTAVRVEELEESLFLLHDRLESNRLAMQRYQNSRSQEAPSRVPESYYRGSALQGKPRGVTRIRLSNPQARDDADWFENGEGEISEYEERAERGEGAVAERESETVITQESFDAFSIPHHQRAKTTKASGPKRAQERVTDERLSVRGDSKKKAPTPAGTEKVAVRAGKPGSLSAYKSALGSYRAGRYDEARVGFEAFMSAGPRRDYVDNALYWLGECHFGLGEFDRSVAFFRRVISEEPEGNKVPDAMLKMSYALQRLGNQKEAAAMLSELQRLYPDTHAARIGASALAEE